MNICRICDVCNCRVIHPGDPEWMKNQKKKLARKKETEPVSGGMVESDGISFVPAYSSGLIKSVVVDWK